jgi:hypothetical protein
MRKPIAGIQVLLSLLCFLCCGNVSHEGAMKVPMKVPVTSVAAYSDGGVELLCSRRDAPMRQRGVPA